VREYTRSRQSHSRAEKKSVGHPSPSKEAGSGAPRAPWATSLGFTRAAGIQKISFLLEQLLEEEDVNQYQGYTISRYYRAHDFSELSLSSPCALWLLELRAQFQLAIAFTIEVTDASIDSLPCQRSVALGIVCTS
jgi:hypothetical protein